MPNQMLRFVAGLLLLVSVRAAELPPALSAALAEGRIYAAAHPPKTGRFEADIQKMLETEKADPVVPERILFVGSSIFRLWTTVRADLAPLPVRNRAFGGSRTSDVLERFDLLVKPLVPKVVVYYCGSNDINGGEPAAAIFARVHDFVERLRASAPEARFVFVSIIRAPDKRARWTEVDAANREVRELCATTPHCRYVDVNPAVFGADGEPRMEFYKEDKLHYHPPAYAEFTKIVKPVVAAAWAEVSSEQAVPRTGR